MSKPKKFSRGSRILEFSTPNAFVALKSSGSKTPLVIQMQFLVPRRGRTNVMSGLQTCTSDARGFHASLFFSTPEDFLMAFSKTQEREQTEFSNRPQPISGKSDIGCQHS